MNASSDWCMKRETPLHGLPILFFVASIFTGCMSFSTTHTARTTEPGQVRISTGFGFVPSAHELQPDKQIDNAGMPDKIGPEAETASIYSEFGLRYGINSRTDVGGVFIYSGNKRVDLKYNLVNLTKYACATGLEGSYWSLAKDNDNYRYRESYKISTIDLIIPFYNTFYIMDEFAVNIVPRIGYRFKKFYKSPGLNECKTNAKCEKIYRMYNNEKNVYDEKIKPLFLGIDFGLIFGRNLGGAIELGFYNGLPVYQFAVSIFRGSESSPTLPMIKNDQTH